VHVPAEGNFLENLDKAITPIIKTLF
jgi:hypothetical protein